MSSKDLPKSHRICGRCHRHREKACICSALPPQRLELRETHCFVLQHPHEQRKFNQSLPILQLCLSPKSLSLAVGRKLVTTNAPSLTNSSRSTQEPMQSKLKHKPPQSTVDESFLMRLHNPNVPLWLLYPSDDATPFQTSLKEYHQQWQLQQQEKQNKGDDGTSDDKPSSPRLHLLILDGTWKFTKEMDAANRTNQYYPAHINRVKLTDDDIQQLPQIRRFDIRTPPSERHLSTAETIAWVISQLETPPLPLSEEKGNALYDLSDGKNTTAHNNPSADSASIHTETNEEPQHRSLPQEDPLRLYNTVMRPLDLMVQQWHSFVEQSQRAKEDSKATKKGKKRSLNSDDL